jgi:hypothetical protein
MNFYTNTGSGFVGAADLKTAMEVFGDISWSHRSDLLNSLFSYGVCHTDEAVVADDRFVDFDDLEA